MTILDVIQRINRILSTNRLNLHNEKQLHGQIKDLLDVHKIPYKYEHRLNESDIPDFLLYDVVVMEVKIKASTNRKHVYKQCCRYMEHAEVQGLILLTARSLGFPGKINNKPCYVINLGKAWL